MALLVGTSTPVKRCTRFASEVSLVVSMPTSTPYMVFSAMTISSIGALPLRSPMPRTVVCITSTPSDSAMMVLATPMPKSWWKCASRRFLMRFCTKSIFRRSGNRFAAENATKQKLDEVLHGVRRQHAEGVDQRQRVHVAFFADALDQVERLFQLGAREVDREEHHLEACLLY